MPSVPPASPGLSLESINTAPPSVIGSKFSGVVLDQNLTATNQLIWRTAPYNAGTVYQTFYLPSNYRVGTTTNEQRYPDLSGLQVFVFVDPGYAQAATLDYTLDNYVIGSGWHNLTSGTVIGTHVDSSGWFNIIFPASLPVTTSMATSLLRFGITSRSTVNGTLYQAVIQHGTNSYVVNGTNVTANLIPDIPFPVTVGSQQGFLLLQGGQATYSQQQGVSGLWYVNPTPLLPTSCQAYQADGATALVPGQKVSLNFRVLALTADNGSDFLGNEYRSCVIQHSGSTIGSNSAAQSGTNTVVWTSPPQPSPFAVLSQYYDVRPQPGVPGYRSLNLVTNGSFEHDGLQTTPSGWQVTTSVPGSNFLVSNGWAQFGLQSVRLSAVLTGGHPTLQVSNSPSNVTPGATYNLSTTFNVLQLDQSCTANVFVNWYSGTPGSLTLISESGPFNAALGISTIAAVVTAPAASTYATVFVSLSGGTGACDVYFDGVSLNTTATTYGDGDTPGWQWLAQAGRSNSIQLAPVAQPNGTAVVDGVLIDPLTPNIAVSVYYSEDDAYTSNNMSEDDWERKLWSRVPETYVLPSKLRCMFPHPIRAKYIKLEYSNLQPRHYDVGQFNQPVTYKKFPTWVGDYFFAQLQATNFVDGFITVTNNALDFAYAYYLDDLHLTPDQPIPAPSSVIPTLTTYFYQNDATDLIDATTLSRINLTMQRFQTPTGSLSSVADASLTAQYANNIVNASPLVATSESPNSISSDYSLVSTTSREAVILEQGLPVMFFFLTCRHAYKVLSAPFEYDRAYFVGIQQVAFLRENYATAADTPMYIESGNDTQNAERQDFVVDADLNWYVY